MNNLKEIEGLERTLRAYKRLSDKLYEVYSSKHFENQFGHWDTETYLGLRNTFFYLVAGETDFDEFFDRFGTPGRPEGKPIAWENTAIVDLVNDLIFSDEPLKYRVKEISRLYKKVLQIEKEFKNNNAYNVIAKPSKPKFTKKMINKIVKEAVK